MSTVSHRCHALVTVIVVSVTLACAAVSSAAMVAGRLSGPAITTFAVTPPIITAMQSAGSAGIPGYDDERCQSLLNDHHRTVSYDEQLTDNCTIVD